MEHRDLPPSLRIGSMPAAPDWRAGLPGIDLESPGVTLREILPGDAASLLDHLGSVDVSRFVEPPPSIEAFDRYILRAHLERQVGRYACFVVVPMGSARRPACSSCVHSTPPSTRRSKIRAGAAYWGSGPSPRPGPRLRHDDRRASPRGSRRRDQRPPQRRAAKAGAVQEGLLRSSPAQRRRQRRACGRCCATTGAAQALTQPAVHHAFRAPVHRTGALRRGRYYPHPSAPTRTVQHTFSRAPVRLSI